MATIEKDEKGRTNILLNQGESALVFGERGIYQLLSEEFKGIISEAQKTQGQSMMDALSDSTEEDSVKVLNDFVLVQLVNLLSEIILSLESNRKN
jgi:TRAP-type mannitol/chloroaromatic compound transport system substrate-binding protein